MLRKTLMVLLMGGGLALTSTAEEVVVRIAPPHAVVEKRGPAPGRDYIWVGGYHRWDGGHYVWVPGRWDRPPRPHAHWEAHRWVKRNGGWVFVEGHWR
jgi:hypothetical protein